MKVFGKILGASMGFVLGGGPLGAILGMAAGHAYDQRITEINWRRMGKPVNDASSRRQEVYASATVVLGAKLAKAGGQVTRAKIDAFKRAFQIKPGDEARIGRVFDQARRNSDGYEPYAFSLAQAFVSQPVVLEDILSGLMQVAAADTGAISPVEADFLRSIGFIFNYGPDDILRIAAKAGARLPPSAQTREAGREARRDGAGDPYLILGLTDAASDNDIKKAYRSLIRKHHPDKLIAQGGSAEFIATANEKMKRINAAYDTVCRTRGIK